MQISPSQDFELRRKETRKAIKECVRLISLVELRELALEYKCVPTYRKKEMELSK